MPPKQVIRSYLVITGLYTLSASLIWGVNTLFLLDAGLNILGVFIANGVFTGSMALFEIPTGVLADTRGRRLSFLLSLAIVSLGTLGYVGVAMVGGGLGLFIAMSVVLGLGYTFYSGAVEAWLVDALQATGYTGTLDQVFARGSIVTGVAMILGTIGGGWLGSLDLTIPFLARAGLLVMVFGIAFFTMHDLGYTPRALTATALPAEMKKIAQASLTFGWREQPVRLLMIAAAIQATFMAWGFHAWQPYFLSLLGKRRRRADSGCDCCADCAGRHHRQRGGRMADPLLRAAHHAVALGCWRADRRGHRRGVGWIVSIWRWGLYLVVMAASGVMRPVRQAYMHQIIPSEQRATVISFDSLVSSTTSMGGQAGLGYLSQVRSIAQGYIAGGAATVLVLPVLMAPPPARRPSRCYPRPSRA